MMPSSSCNVNNLSCYMCFVNNGLADKAQHRAWASLLQACLQIYLWPRVILTFDFLTPKFDHFVLLLCVASTLVDSFSKYRVHNFGKRRTDGRKDGRTNWFQLQVEHWEEFPCKGRSLLFIKFLLLTLIVTDMICSAYAFCSSAAQR